jgi:hypothetical protein
MSPATGGGDMGGEARSKRAGRRGHGGAHRGRGERIVREREDGAAAAVRSASADTRPGKERRGGDGVLGVRSWGRTSGERKKGGGGDGAPFIGDTAGSGGWSAGDATRQRGVGEGRGAGMAVGRCATSVKTGERRR